MPTYKTPDVYIEEIPLFPPSVAEVETAIPVFIGYTNKAVDLEAHDLTNVPTRIMSLLEYEQYYGGPEKEALTIDVTDTTREEPAGSGTFVLDTRTVIASLAAPTGYNMYYSVKGFYDNGGGVCYIISVGPTSAGAFDKGELIAGVDEAAKIDEITLFVIPEVLQLAATATTDVGEVNDHVLAQCMLLKDRFHLMDVNTDAANGIFNDSVDFRSDYVGIDNLKYGASYYPFITTSQNYGYDETVVVITYPAPANALSTPDITDGDTIDAVKGTSTSAYNLIIKAIQKLKVILPPTPLMAGVYARVDSERGVWKAPANVGLRAVVGPVVKITNQDQDNMNIDTVGGKSINAIRAFTGKGTLVWGARTLAGNDNEWRYVPVRRFFNMVEESVKKSTYWAVFEPNDANTWVKVKAMIENYLILKWKDGALAGAKPEHAFYVKVGIGITMTALDILEGRMNVEIGMAVVRPAEFIILKFSHKMQES